MHVRVRYFGEPDKIVVVESRVTKINQFRRIIFEKFGVEPKLQRLFYGGKVLEDGYTFHDYNIRLNDVVQLMVKQSSDVIPNDCDITNEDSSSKKTENEVKYEDATSRLYVIDDLVDIRDREEGAWFEGRIVRIVYDPKFSIVPENQEIVESDNNIGSVDQPPLEAVEAQSRSSMVQNDSTRKEEENHLLFEVQLDNDSSLHFCKKKEIRPRARTVIDVKHLKAGQTVMLNYNINEPSEKGLWYDFKVAEVKKLRRRYQIIGTLYLGKEAIPQNDTKVIVHDKIYTIEEVVPLSQRSEEYKDSISVAPEPRSKPLKCTACRDNEKVNCKECGCHHCHKKDSPGDILLCDECDYGYHMKCLDPPLTSVPEDDWYCPSCKRDANEVVAPGAAKQTKKTIITNRDWGRGMACVGKTKTCTMPLNHFGAIPGIEVGMCWRFRIQLSESGVHRPPVSGIHGRDVEGAYSIVLGGGYEDDYDNGYEFTYTGSGGRDLSGNKRTAEQSCDQTLTRENKALARNCAVKTISEDGADAGDAWKEGKPVRVARSYKMLKHFPTYAPKEGFRYDGIYKVVKYYPEKGLSGYIVWKYLLQRDDPNPAPWEPDAKQFPIIYPDGYLEAAAEKKALKEKGKKAQVPKKRRLKENTSSDTESTPSKKSKTSTGAIESGKGKTALKENNQVSDTRAIVSDEDDTMNTPKRSRVSAKGTIPAMFNKGKRKEEKSILTSEETDIINADVLNSKIWADCIDRYKNSARKDFIEQITQEFLCIICQGVVASPVTTPCLHNFCMVCLKLAFKSSESRQCPCCRKNLADVELTPNEHLKNALRVFLPGYDVGKK